MPVIRERKIVVAALIADRLERVLLTQRAPHQSMPGYWEFPGGKVEPGESPEQAICRELREEIGVSATCGRIWQVIFHAYETFDVLLLVYAVSYGGTEVPRAIDVAAVEWTPIAKLRDVLILPADAPLIDELAKMGIPSHCMRVQPI